jgi:F-type H+-transporting ATPase subunit epsilon
MLHFELVTPEKLIRSEEVYMVTVPGTEGDFGVLEGHAPVMATIAIRGGFAEVNANGLTVLAEQAG